MPRGIEACQKPSNTGACVEVDRNAVLFQESQQPDMSKSTCASTTQGKTDASLRLFVKSGGCSGFSYGLAFDDNRADDDRIELHGNVPIIIDAFSAQYVDGAEIDYVDSLMVSGFAINNPNAVSSCSCGQSCNTDGSPARAGGCH